jgi:hypothetical protein
MNFRERVRPIATPAPPLEETSPAKPAVEPEPDWVIARLPPLEPAQPAAARRRGRVSASTAAESIAGAMRADGPFARAVRDLLAKLFDHFGESVVTSRLAIASVRPGAGASTLSLALAHAACDDGLRVLLVDCHGVNSLLAARKEGEAPSGRRARDGRVRVDERGGGEISFLPFPDDHGAADDLDEETDFDLVLLDCGSLSTARHLIKRLKAADALLAVDRGDASRETVRASIEAVELDRCCVGVALTPTRGEAWRKAS